MPAWNHTSSWDDSAIEKYRAFAARRAAELYKKHEVIDCANLCLKILIEFASGNGLPVAITGKTGSKNVATDLVSRLPEWSSADAFMKAVIDGIEANEIIDGHGSEYRNTVTVSVSDMLPGDMLGHLSGASTGDRAGTWGHMQLVTRTSLRSPYGRATPTSGSAEIYQGNLTWLLWYKPTTVQKGNYYFRNKFYYKREGTDEQDGVKLWTDSTVTPIRWNFKRFNAMGTIYDYVKPRDTDFA